MEALDNSIFQKLLNDPQFYLRKLKGFHRCSNCGGDKELYWIHKDITFPKNNKKFRRIDLQIIICKECDNFGNRKLFDFNFYNICEDFEVEK